MRTAIIELRASEGNETAVADFLQAHASRSRTLEPACVDFQIAQDPDLSQAFFIIMLYESADAQAAHRETAHFQRFLEECIPLLEDAPDGTKFFTRRLLDRIA
jgi:quinol monooxygenase YgiN